MLLRDNILKLYIKIYIYPRIKIWLVGGTIFIPTKCVIIVLVHLAGLCQNNPTSRTEILSLKNCVNLFEIAMNDYQYTGTFYSSKYCLVSTYQ